MRYHLLLVTVENLEVMATAAEDLDLEGHGITVLEDGLAIVYSSETPDAEEANETFQEGFNAIQEAVAAVNVRVDFFNSHFAGELEPLLEDAKESLRRLEQFKSRLKIPADN